MRWNAAALFLKNNENKIDKIRLFLLVVEKVNIKYISKESIIIIDKEGGNYEVRRNIRLDIIEKKFPSLFRVFSNYPEWILF